MDSQLIWLLLRPSALFVICLSVGMVFSTIGFRRTGLLMTSAAVLAVAAVGIFSIPDHLLRDLENRYPRPATMPSEITGILMLGGITNQHISEDRNAFDLSASAERLVEVAALARTYPRAEIWLLGRNEAASTRHILTALGVPPDRLRHETKSANTYENLTFAKQQISPETGERWLLVTSAWHMPRAMAVARAINLPVIAYPTDYRTLATPAVRIGADVAQNLLEFDIAVKEFVGMWVYRARGWIDGP